MSEAPAARPFMRCAKGLKFIIELKPGDAFEVGGGGSRGVVERHSCGGTYVSLAETTRSQGKTHDGKIIDIVRRGRKVQISSYTEVILVTDTEEKDSIMAEAKKKAAKARVTIASLIKHGISKKWSNERILKEVKAKFPKAKTGKNSIDYYRSKMRTAAKAKVATS